MKNRLILPLLLFSYALLSAQQKQALIVAVARYPSISGWSNTAAENDTALLLPLLREQGFDKIRVICNEEATRSGILTALDSSLSELKPGGVFWFHFSGHGQQIWDQNGDENDRLDEAIIPYGAPAQWKPGVRTDLHLRDEELGKALKPIAARLGTAGQLLITLDACHAGTGTRSLCMRMRGSSEIFGPEKDARNPDSPQPDHIDHIPDNAFALFAAAPEENNYEYNWNGTYYGSLSFAMCKALRQIRNGEKCDNWRQRISQVMAEIAPFQHLMSEGNAAMPLLGGHYKPATPVLQITQVIDSRLLWVEGGQMASILEGSELAIYPGSQQDTSSAPPLSVGHVIRSLPLQLKVKLETPVPSAQLRHCKVYLKKRALGLPEVKVSTASLPPPFAKALLNALAATPGVLLTEDSADLSISFKNNVLTLENHLKSVLLAENAAQEAGVFVEKILEYQRGKWLRNLDFEMPDVHFEIRLIPYKADKNGGFNPSETVDSGATIGVKVGDALAVEVRNTGRNGAYFTLVDFQPDNRINPVIPDFMPIFLDAGATWHSAEDGGYLPGLITPPCGTELVKLYATNFPVNLQEFFQAPSRSATAARAQNIVEQLFYFSDNRLGAVPAAAMIASFSAHFNIIPNQ